MRHITLAILLLCIPAIAQDERHVTSPDGQLEFRLGSAQPEPGGLSRLAYQVYFRGKPLIDTSLMGLNIHFQEPLLGENAGLTKSTASETAVYHSLLAEYMQNGSIGRRIDVEVRVADDGVAFRYRIPRSSPLMDLLIEDETTEFNIPAGGLGQTDSEAQLPFPFVFQLPGAVSVAIAEVREGNYPPAWLERLEGNILITRLGGRTKDPGIAVEATTPFTCPWRVLIVGLRREHLMQSKIMRSLSSER
ncbi:MAG TPA: glycoside hydrolase family 97 N-terminal domain-containing protein [Bryobacteraceae bacterium]|nr:glycoside hydrolase family 97 N-terminal domain-containing protein [Bryobacteraceae bacterium]